MWNLKDKINKQTKQKHIHRCREQAEGGQRGGRLGRWVKRAKGLRSADCWLQNSHGGVKYSLGNILNNIPLTMCAVRWVVNLGEVTTL